MRRPGGSKVARAAGARIVLSIGPGETLPEAATPAVLGSKACNLARMAAIGLNVPPAFVIGTGFCATPEQATPAIWHHALADLERATGLRLGDPRRPLLLSVRSGAPVSMPGMMETLLDIGLNDATLPGLVRTTGQPRLAWDAYRRLVAGFGEVVAGIDPRRFEADLDAVRDGEDERALDFSQMREIARRHLETFAREAGRAFPQSAEQQLSEAVAAVFRSWGSDKAVAYRDRNRLGHDMGTAVTVQRMVFGNAGGLSGAGVGFSRDPSTGEPSPWVDFLFNAQGEDVVSGRRTARGHDDLAAVAPALWAELVRAAAALERHFGDMQDFEFTIEDGVLFLLQTRSGKRTPHAAARIALDMLDEGLIDAETARQRTRGLDAHALTIRRIAAAGGGELPLLATAASAAGGVVSGAIAFDEDGARRLRQVGRAVILVRRDAETRDIAALDLADGLLTRNGARTSHAAVVARQLGKVCLVGCEALEIDEARRCLAATDVRLAEGTEITLDGNEGRIFAGRAAVVEDVPGPLLARLAALQVRP
ncbi:PEP/pyruvate-binding domain-containing protein [Stella sp.]|uniref:PEP/pyruvate-binding domain-containing protein n=1 Tax=Stella sp. TaxID=2912054 RepID=UPI0035AF2D86